MCYSETTAKPKYWKMNEAPHTVVPWPAMGIQRPVRGVCFWSFYMLKWLLRTGMIRSIVHTQKTWRCLLLKWGKAWVLFVQHRNGLKTVRLQNPCLIVWFMSVCCVKSVLMRLWWVSLHFVFVEGGPIIGHIIAFVTPDWVLPHSYFRCKIPERALLHVYQQ